MRVKRQAQAELVGEVTVLLVRRLGQQAQPTQVAVAAAVGDPVVPVPLAATVVPVS